MKNHLLPRLDQLIEEYNSAHHGENPLYVLVSSSEAGALLDEVRRSEAQPEEVLITEYKGCKIVEHSSVREGEMQLSDELPGIGG